MPGGRPPAAAVPASPFFHPSSTPQHARHVVVVQQSPGGTRRQYLQQQQQRQQQQQPGDDTTDDGASTTSHTVKEHKSGLIGCTANLVNAIVGSGIVGIPYAISCAGFSAGILLVVLVAAITEKSLRLLVSTAKHVHAPSYETTAEAAFGVFGFRFIAVNMGIISFGAMLSYLMIVKETFSTIAGVDAGDAAARRSILVLVSLAIMVPLSCQRDMADLAKTSRLNVFIDTALVSLVVYNAPIKQSWEDGADLEDSYAESLFFGERAFKPATIFVGVGVLSFAYVCQHSAFIIAGSLQNPTVKRWGVVTRAGLFVSASLALTMGVFGYLGFGDAVAGNVLSSLDAASVSANVARGLLGTTMLFVYPLGRRAHEGDDTSILNRRDRRITLTVALYLLAVIPAALCTDLGAVLAVAGAIGGSCLSYIGPGLVYLGIHGGRFLELVQRSWLGSCLRSRMAADVHDAATALPVEDDTRKRSDNSNKVVTKTTRRQESDVETTPLMMEKQPTQGGKQRVDAEELETRAPSKASPQQQDPDATEEDENIFFYVMKEIAWYLTLMPVWYMIARAGRQGLTVHVHDMALQSPHPIRIGDVEYKRVAVSKAGTIEVDSPQLVSGILRPPDAATSPLARASGARDDGFLMPPLLLAPASFDEVTRSARSINEQVGSINEQIGKNLLAQQQQSRQRSEKGVGGSDREKLEPDPQGDPPSWIDFIVAIFFLVFGVVALFAGLFSMYIEGG